MSLAGEGGLPQFASGCAQSLESTSKAYGNLNEGVFLQVTDSTNDLQQKALDSRALIIVAIIIELSLLSLLSLIAIGCIRKFIRYSKVKLQLRIYLINTLSIQLACK